MQTLVVPLSTFFPIGEPSTVLFTPVAKAGPILYGVCVLGRPLLLLRLVRPICPSSNTFFFFFSSSFFPNRHHNYPYHPHRQTTLTTVGSSFSSPLTATTW